MGVAAPSSVVKNRHRKYCVCTYCSPYSQVFPTATFQHSSRSSLTFPNRRPLLAPLRCFFSSFVNFRLFDLRSSSSPTRSTPWTWLVAFSAESSSATFLGSADIRYLKLHQNRVIKLDYDACTLLLSARRQTVVFAGPPCRNLSEIIHRRLKRQ